MCPPHPPKKQAQAFIGSTRPHRDFRPEAASVHLKISDLPPRQRPGLGFYYESDADTDSDSSSQRRESYSLDIRNFFVRPVQGLYEADSDHSRPVSPVIQSDDMDPNADPNPAPQQSQPGASAQNAGAQPLADAPPPWLQGMRSGIFAQNVGCHRPGSAGPPRTTQMKTATTSHAGWLSFYSN